MGGNVNWPDEIRLSPDGKSLTLVWPDGVRHEVSAELLRVESPSAEVQGHTPSQKTTIPGKRNVAIKTIREEGRYAVRLVFDDGHDTGIYTWDQLREFGERGEELFSAYLEALAEKRLTR